MRISAGQVANVVGWIILIGLVPVAFVLVVLWGPLALIIFGLLTLSVCTSLDLNEDVPSSGPGVFAARFTRPRSPEEAAALRADRLTRLSPLRFYRGCGIALLFAGMAGFTWILLH